jgi:hypothetical protein
MMSLMAEAPQNDGSIDKETSFILGFENLQTPATFHQYLHAQTLGVLGTGFNAYLKK